MDTSTVNLVACFIILVIFLLLNNRSRKTPPGPMGFPFVGYIPFMSSKPYIDFQNLAKKYGPVFSVRLGSQNVIVLDDYQSMKDAFSLDAFMGRPPTLPFNFSQETLDTGAFNGLPWKEQRRFSLSMLRDLGFGKSHLEDMIKEEICDLLVNFKESDGHPINIRPLLVPSMSNNISSMVFGKRRKYDDPVRIMLDRSLQEGAKNAGQVAWQIFFPWVTETLKLLNRFRSKTAYDKSVQELTDYTMKEIDEHEKVLDQNNVKDYIDGYLLEIKKRDDPAFCKEVLKDMIGIFFNAGSDTVRLTIDWLMLIMASYTDVQKKIQTEIDNTIGRDRFPSWDDHLKMPYTEAVIMEQNRWRTIIPINILRYTLWDTELNGYFIPKHSFVASNLWAVHHNPKYWGSDAEIFLAERFLSEDGNKVVNSDYYIPFSIGKRACPGESLARVEVFLYFTAILQKFHVSLPEGNIPDFEGDLGISLCPKPYELCINKRL